MLNPFACLLAMMLAFCGTPVIPRDGQTASEDKLKWILDNIRANEELYKDIDISYSSKYFVDKSVMEPSTWEPTLLETLKFKQRCVRQKDLYYVSKEGQGVQLDGKPYVSEQFGAFDGEKTLTLTGNLANIVHDRRDENCLLFHSHAMLLQDNYQLCYPVSLFLQGGPALASHPRAGAYAQGAVYYQFTYVGTEEVDGLRCVKLHGRGFIKKAAPKPDEERWKVDLWIAIDRNYFPIKSVGYQLRSHATVPSCTARLSEFKEIQPGVWFPFRLTYSSTEPAHLRRGQEVAQKKVEFAVENVSLTPNHPAAFFRSIAIPNSARVYELRNNKIIKGYVQGGKEPQSAPQPQVIPSQTATSRPYFLWAGILLLVVGFFVAAKRRTA